MTSANKASRLLDRLRTNLEKGRGFEDGLLHTDPDEHGNSRYLRTKAENETLCEALAELGAIEALPFIKKAHDHAMHLPLDQRDSNATSIYAACIYRLSSEIVDVWDGTTIRPYYVPKRSPAASRPGSGGAAPAAFTISTIELRIDGPWSNTILRLAADRSISYEARSLGIIYYKGRGIDRGGSVHAHAMLSDGQLMRIAESLEQNRFFDLEENAPHHVADGVRFTVTVKGQRAGAPIEHVASGYQGMISPELGRVVMTPITAWKALGMELIVDPGT
jgi:hypothetical protein